MLCGLAEGMFSLAVYIVGGLFLGAVKVLWSGLCRIVQKNREEVAALNEERRLLALYRRKDKLEYINGGTAQAWAKFQTTKTWRGLLWEIEDAEERLARLEKAAV